MDVLVRSYGGAPDELLLSCGLAADTLNYPEETMSVTDLTSILNVVAERVPGLESAGLKLASVQGLEVLGVLGNVLCSSATLAEAFTRVQRYMALHNQGEQWRLSGAGPWLAIQRFEQAYTGQDLRQYHELALANCFRLTQILAGRDIRPQRLEFTHRPLAPEKEYRRFFGCEVRFDQEFDQLLVEAQILTLPVAVAENTGELSAVYIQQLAGRYENDLRAQLTTLIMQTLGAQQHSLECIAALMGVHLRTLQRRCEKEGIVFRKLVNEVRNNLACWHLSSSGMDITMLAAAPGYTDVSGFSRAFRQWHGCSPRQWRKLNRTADRASVSTY